MHINNSLTFNEAFDLCSNIVESQKKTHWIRADLTVAPSSGLSRFFFTVLKICGVVMKRFEWLAAIHGACVYKLFKVDHFHSQRNMESLRMQVEAFKNEDLSAIYEQARSTYMEIVSKTVHREPVKVKWGGESRVMEMESLKKVPAFYDALKEKYVVPDALKDNDGKVLDAALCKVVFEYLDSKKIDLNRLSREQIIQLVRTIDFIQLKDCDDLLSAALSKLDGFVPLEGGTYRMKFSHDSARWIMIPTVREKISSIDLTGVKECTPYINKLLLQCPNLKEFTVKSRSVNQFGEVLKKEGLVSVCLDVSDAPSNVMFKEAVTFEGWSQNVGVRLTNVDQVPDPDLIAMYRSVGPRLLALNFKNNKSLSVNSLCDLLAECRQLRTIRLERCPELYVSLEDHRNINCLDTVKEIYIDGMYVKSHINFRVFPNLEKLTITNCPTPELLFSIPPSVKFLDASHNSFDRGVNCFINYYINNSCTHLNLRDTGVCPKDLDLIMTKLVHLKEIDLSSNWWLASRHIKIFKECFKQTKVIS